ncbi:Uncharacterised protein [Serratia rubidaea]|uniref:Uncharacterized protein n=2 Tax=Serratia rubidaea TaxID=61652 RepID=A0A3S4GC85_SERRU|nr:Uncharacterised protein [Serratia rubidaea]
MYQKLRQAFLASLTPESLHQALKLQLSQDATLVLQQPKGEAETNMKQLQDVYDGIMSPAPAVVSDAPKPEGDAATPDGSAQ